MATKPKTTPLVNPYKKLNDTLKSPELRINLWL